jgi:hypothetical protein
MLSRYSLFRFLLALCLVTAADLWFGARASAEHIISTYVQVDWDETTLYNTASGWDQIYNEEECDPYHAYETRAEITGSSSNASATAGHASSTSVSWQANGDYTFYGDLIISCGCGVTPTGSQQKGVSIKVSFFTGATYLGIVNGKYTCRYSNWACVGQPTTGSCGYTPIDIVSLGPSCSSYQLIAFLRVDGECVYPGLGSGVGGGGPCT